MKEIEINRRIPIKKSKRADKRIRIESNAKTKILTHKIVRRNKINIKIKIEIEKMTRRKFLMTTMETNRSTAIKNVKSVKAKLGTETKNARKSKKKMKNERKGIKKQNK